MHMLYDKTTLKSQIFLYGHEAYFALWLTLGEMAVITGYNTDNLFQGGLAELTCECDICSELPVQCIEKQVG